MNFIFLFIIYEIIFGLGISSIEIPRQDFQKKGFFYGFLIALPIALLLSL